MIFLGTFNAERYWKDPEMASLPAFADPQAEAIADVMDELQFLCCNGNDDYLLSSASMNSAHKDYLNALGFHFSNNSQNIKPVLGDGRSIFECMVEKNIPETLPGTTSSVVEVSPYAISTGFESFCLQHGVKQNFPSETVVKKVNSKIFSGDIRKQLTKCFSSTVHDSHQLMKVGGNMLKEAPVIIKDPFGVSGKGSIYIDSENKLRSIAGHIKKQEQQGKTVELIIERYLNKMIDFSCHFNIGEDGITGAKTVQQMCNKGFSFYKIGGATESLIRFLEQHRYFDIMDDIGKAIFIQGYHGPVCIDSMILQDRQVIALVEINARKSMGMLSLFMNRFLSGFDTCGRLIALSCRLTTSLRFETLLEAFRQHNMLFTGSENYGILPLSANTFDINARLFDTYPLQGRLYLGLAGKEIDDDNSIAAIEQLLLTLGSKVVP